jgi:hypothetical protein
MQRKVLISVSCNGLFDFSDLELAKKIKTELQPWFGKQVEDWSHIKTYKVKYALPQLAVLKMIWQLQIWKLVTIYIAVGSFNGSYNAAKIRSFISWFDCGEVG